MKTPQNATICSFFFISFIAFHLSPCFTVDAIDEFKACGVNYNCGDLVNITYPFWGNGRHGFCGRREFELNCKHNRTTTIQINSLEYNVLKINQSDHRMRIARSDLFDDHCPKNQTQTATLDHHLFVYSSNNQNISVWYNCSAEALIPERYKFRCSSEVEKIGRANYAFEPSAATWSLQIEECTMKIDVTVAIEGLKEGLKNRTRLVEKAVRRGFDVEYGNLYTVACNDCKESGGACGGNGTYPFYCLCGSGGDAHPFFCGPACAHEESNEKWKKAIIGVGSGIGGLMLMGTISLILLRLQKKYAHAPPFLLRNNSSDPSTKELEKGENYMGVHLFSYGELEEATHKFNPAKELGDGGFGTVYYGKLRDGREVAVKRLFENNYRKVEHFMNEVKILTRLHHQHLVALYGCTSRRSRELLLVYEFIPNGTLADHLHGNRAKPGELPWHARLKIAIETASALAYLHASKTIHRDVKTTNILLDKNFCVKVADFGLSCLSPTQATHVSTAPQGTPGYVDPEYQECYQLTNKSDVFSFGVVLVELISSKPAVDMTRHRHEINLWTMAINKIQNNDLHNFVDPSLGFETDQSVTDMICAVAELAFQCLQSVKDTRPSMLEALEILKNIESRSCDKRETEEIDKLREDDELLKGGSVPQSPDSVTVPWISKASTPNGSG